MVAFFYQIECCGKTGPCLYGVQVRAVVRKQHLHFKGGECKLLELHTKLYITSSTNSGGEGLRKVFFQQKDACLYNRDHLGWVVRELHSSA